MLSPPGELLLEERFQALERNFKAVVGALRLRGPSPALDALVSKLDADQKHWVMRKQGSSSPLAKLLGYLLPPPPTGRDAAGGARALIADPRHGRKGEGRAKLRAAVALEGLFVSSSSLDSDVELLEVSREETAACSE